MGQEYSAEQKVQFMEFRRMIDAAIQDASPYTNFGNSLHKVCAAISSKHPFYNQYGIPLRC